MASLYVTAAGTLCIMWQERLPYSVGAATTAGVSSPDTLSQDGGNSGSDNGDTTTTAAAAAAASPGSEVGAPVGAPAHGRGSGSGEMVPSSTGSMAVRSSSPLPAVEGTPTAEDEDKPRLDTVVDAAAPAGGREDGGGTASPTEEESNGELPAAATATATAGESGDGESAEAAVATTTSPSSGQRPEDGAGPKREKEEEKSWLDVGGVLGTDDLYLRSSAYLEGERCGAVRCGSLVYFVHPILFMFMFGPRGGAVSAVSVRPGTHCRERDKSWGRPVRINPRFRGIKRDCCWDLTRAISWDKMQRCKTN